MSMGEVKNIVAHFASNIECFAVFINVGDVHAERLERNVIKRKMIMGARKESVTENNDEDKIRSLISDYVL